MLFFLALIFTKLCLTHAVEERSRDKVYDATTSFVNGTQGVLPPTFSKISRQSRSIDISWRTHFYATRVEIVYGITLREIKVVKVPAAISSYSLGLLEPGTTYKVTIRAFYNDEFEQSVSEYITTLPVLPEGVGEMVVEVHLMIADVPRSLWDRQFGEEILKGQVQREMNLFNNGLTGVSEINVFSLRRRSESSWMATVYMLMKASADEKGLFQSFVSLTKNGQLGSLRLSPEQFSFQTYLKCCQPLLHQSFDQSDAFSVNYLALKSLKKISVGGQCGNGVDLSKGDLFFEGRITNAFREITIATFVKVMAGEGLHPIFSAVDKSGQIRLEVLRGKVVWMMYSIDDARGFVVSTKKQIESKRWHHILASYSELTGVAKLFVDGILQAKDTSNIKNELFWWSNPYFGKYYSGAYVYKLDGKLDEVYIFPCLRPWKEIQAMAEGCYKGDCHYNKGIAGPSAQTDRITNQANTCYCAGVGLSTNCEEVFWYPKKIIAGPESADGWRGFDLVFIASDGKFERRGSDVFINYGRGELVANVPRRSGKSWYWLLPPEFVGNKLASYGQRLSYKIGYYSQRSEPSNGKTDRRLPDVVIQGRYQTYLQVFLNSPPSSEESAEVWLKEGKWFHRSGKVASKEEIMAVLLEIENIFIRTDYGKDSKELRLYKVAIDTLGPSRTSPLDVATRLIKCTCRTGKSGVACEATKRVTKVCNSAGSLSGQSNPIPLTGRCICKTNVVGKLCDQCKNGTFNLDAENPAGCTPCFCNGITTSCRSAKLSKSQISINAQDISNLSLRTVDGSTSFQDSLVYNPLTNSVTFKGFNGEYTSANDVFYWELPLRYCGDKLKSYGGILRYTVSYLSRPADQPVQGPNVILTGNGITLHYTESGDPPVGTKYYYSVILDENFWRRPYGGPVKREEMIMALAKIESILLRATFSNEMIATSLYELTLDSAVYDPLTSRRDVAPMVEECLCTKAYFGLSCQYCNKGYRKQHGSGHLGRCRTCDCNGHSDDCDGETAVCKLCQHNTNGTTCERCSNGFYGNARSRRHDACKPCPCPLSTPSNQFSKTCILDRDGLPTCTNCPTGYSGRRCERCAYPYVGNPMATGGKCEIAKKINCDHCDKRGTVKGRCDAEKCQCKEGVAGTKCNHCKAGYFYLDENNIKGCTKCFCMHATKTCTSSLSYRDKLLLTSNDHSLSVASGDGKTHFTKGVYKGRGNSEFILGGLKKEKRTLYWFLPKPFLGIKVKSYGGKLQYTISYDADSSGSPYRDKDIIIQGNGIALFYKHDRLFYARRIQNVEVSFSEGKWQKENNGVASRDDIMLVLARLDQMLIRATYNTRTILTSINGVSMEYATSYFARYGRAFNVERCSCPEGHAGLSCEVCSRGYTKSVDRFGRFQCIRCNCHRHSLECDPETGVCKNCQHNTMGKNCEICLPGYYGHAKRGFTGDCIKCRCPLQIPSNQFSSTCRLASDGKATCDDCQMGYAGRNCGSCAPGYTGNPRLPGGKCRKTGDQGKLIPRVTIIPDRRIDKRGFQATFKCTVTGKSPIRVVWSRQDGQPLPSRAQVTTVGSTYTLRIRNLQPADGESYICTARNELGIASKSAYLVVSERKVEPIRVHVTPKSLTIHSGATASFVCRARSIVTETLRWIRDGYPKLPPGATVNDGVLTIPNVQRLWSGLYTCVGSNQVSVDRTSVQLRVGLSILPQVTVSPTQHTVDVGQTVTWKCTATGFPYPKITWSSKLSGKFPPNVRHRNGLLTISRVRAQDEGTYFCTATNNGGSVTKGVALFVRGPGKTPVITVQTPVVRVKAGQVVRLVCVGFGTPRPKITWTHLLFGRLRRGHVRDGVLSIAKVSKLDEGDYICKASNTYGQASGVARLIVNTEGGSKPTVRVRPARQNVTPGSSVTIFCEITGNPSPVVAWRRINGILTRNHKVERDRLEIKQATIKDTGRYVCSARNAKGASSASAMLLVQNVEPPALRILPRYNITVYSGETAHFVCQVQSGQPPPDVQWMDAQGRAIATRKHLNRGKELMLKFEEAQRLEGGIYYCRAKNKAGTVNATVRLTVLGIPRVSMSPRGQVSALVGENLSILCRGTGEPPPAVSLKHPKGHPLRDMAVEASSWSVRLSFKVKNKSEGRYTCLATNNLGIAEENLYLRVFDEDKRPLVAADPVSQNVSVGDKVEFTCNSSGVPTPVMSWFRAMKDGRTVLLTQKITSELKLLISKAGVLDGGMYICASKNRAGLSETSVELIVSGKLPPPRAVLMVDAIISVKRGRPLNLKCSGQGNPTPTVRWEKAGNISSLAIVNEGVLEIASVQVSDAGLYYCVASNEAGVDKAIINVSVIDPPSIIALPTDTIYTGLGDAAVIHCNATGYPLPDVEWFHNEILLGNNTSPALYFQYLRPENQGQYKCRASNIGGSVEYVVNLRIKELPSVSIVGGISVRVVPIGRPFKAVCVGEGSPEPILTWVRVGQKMPDDVRVNHGILHVASVGPEHAGTYRCTVTNSRGSVRAEIGLIAQAAPSVMVSPQTHETSINKDARLICLATGLPIPRIEWYKLNGSMPRDHSVEAGSLTINRVQSHHTGTYVCRATNSEGASEGYVQLKVKDFVPKFTQNTLSYMIFPKISRALYKSHIEISFKPDKGDGLILYNGEPNKDFISLGLKNSYVVFQYNLGSGPSHIESTMKLTLHDWHTVVAARDGLDGILRVDTQPIVYGRSHGRYTGLNLNQDLLLGGSNNISSLLAQTKQKHGFAGCISRLVIGGNELDLAQDAVTIMNITDCNSCESEPCLNGGVCEEIAGKSGFVCRCPVGFVGNTCQQRVERCFPNACGPHGKCMNLDESGFKCRCPIGRYGQRCSQGKIITTPFFNQTSFLTYSGMRDSWERIALFMTFKPLNKNGVLLFNGRTASGGTGDFISVAMVDGHMELRFDSGSGMAVVRNLDNVTLGLWNTIHVDRYRQFGSLQLNGRTAYKGRSPGETIGLNLDSNLFIGGHRNLLAIRDRVDTDLGFTGCIQEVTINSNRIQLVKDYSSSKDVTSCHATSLACDSNPCQNGGKCEVVSALSYRCKCSRRYQGNRCQTLIKRCGSIENCLNNGICLEGAFPPHCVCQLGFVGKACEEAVRTDDSVYLQGEGFLEYSRNLSSIVEQSSIQFDIKTRDSNSLIFWHSESEGTSQSNPDFLYMGLREGRIVASFELGSGLALLITQKEINDGQWHSVNFTRRGRDGTLFVDNKLVGIGQSRGLNKHLDITGSFFVGGGPNIVALTNNRFQKGLTGCLSNMYIEDKLIFLQRMASRGLGVHPCTERVIKERSLA